MICPPRHLKQRWGHWIFLGAALGLCDADFLQALDHVPTKKTAQSASVPDFIETELKILVKEFGAEAERIPQDFLAKVCRWVRLYQTRDHSDMARLLGPERERFESVRQQFKKADLPPDLAFVTLVESNFKPKARSSSGHAGLWQFERVTARLNGLEVNDRIDERLDAKKSTVAACRYFSKLTRILGPKASLLVVVAAYNLGPSRLQARMKAIEDTESRHDFWLLYSTRTVPALTRTHIARLMAAILIGRHEKEFGFETSKNTETARYSNTALRAPQQLAKAAKP
jgi:membrane-bound lytic murein transglycosylase D